MKIVALFLVMVMAFFAFAPAGVAQERESGGLGGFLVGFCFGIRSAAAYNDGKDLHWREWISLVPIADIVGMVFNAVDGMNGMTTADLAQRYHGNYY